MNEIYNDKQHYHTYAAKENIQNRRTTKYAIKHLFTKTITFFNTSIVMKQTNRHHQSLATLGGTNTCSGPC